MIAFLTVIENKEVRSKLEQIYINYYKDMFYVAYDILKDHHEAEDVVQNSILKLFTRLNQINEINSNKTKTFLVIIVRNLSINIYNQRKIRNAVPIDEFAEVLPLDDISLDSYIIMLERLKWMAEQLLKINPAYIDALTLKYYYGYSHLEIAELLNITEGNVRIRLYRAKQSLKDVLQKGDIEVEGAE